MLVALVVFAVTTIFALLSVYFTASAGLHHRLLPWTGGLLLGIGAFWVFPELLGQRGWAVAATGIAAVVAILALVNRYVYPVCPVCASGEHSHEPRELGGWSLLAAGCLHSLLDGWMIAGQLGALSWGFIVHKAPESLAVGFLASRLAPTRRAAVAAVCAIQAAMLAGCVTAQFIPPVGSLALGIVACATLLFFGFLALQEEYRHHGMARAVYAAAPGLAAALLVRML